MTNVLDNTVIPAGYRLSVTTRENDGDNYRTVVKEGLSKSDVDFLTDLCKAFQQDTDYANRISNIYLPSSKAMLRVYSVVAPIMLKHAQTEYRPVDPENLSLDEICLIFNECDELYELGIFGEEWFTRVVQNFKVEYVDVPVMIKNVTSAFE